MQGGGVRSVAADGGVSPSLGFSAMSLQSHGGGPGGGGGGVGGGGGDRKEKKVSSIRKARQEVTGSPLVHLSRTLPSSSFPSAPSSSASSPIITASALPFLPPSHTPPPTPPTTKRKSSRKFGVMIDVPIKPSSLSSSPPKRKVGGSRALVLPEGMEGVGGVGPKAVVATVSPLMSDRTVGGMGGMGRGGVAIAAAVNIRGEGSSPMMSSFDFQGGGEGAGWVDQGEVGSVMGGFPPPISRGPQRSGGRRFSSPHEGDGQALPHHGGFTRQSSAPPVSSALSYTNSSPSPEPFFAPPPPHVERGAGEYGHQQPRFPLELLLRKREEQQQRQSASPPQLQQLQQPATSWPDFPSRDGYERQPAPHSQAEWPRQPSPSFTSPSPPLQEDGLSYPPRPSAAFLDEATSTAVLSTLAASLSQLHRTTSAPAPVQLPGQTRERRGDVGDGRGGEPRQAPPPPSLLLQQPQLQQAAASLLAERQLQWMRQFKQSNPALQSLSADATAFLAALSAQLNGGDGGAGLLQPPPAGRAAPPSQPPSVLRGPSVSRPPSSSHPPLSDPRPLSFSSASLAESTERQLRHLQLQIDAQQKHIQQRLQLHEGLQRLKGNASRAAEAGYGQQQQLQQRMPDLSLRSVSPLPQLPPQASDVFAALLQQQQRPHSSHGPHEHSSRPQSASHPPLPPAHGGSGARGLQTPCPLAASTGCLEQFSSLAELQQHYIHTHMLG